jgi:flavin reductase (DIM6/NTAB) family NADH-FMN oxidoreductase RutF
MEAIPEDLTQTDRYKLLTGCLVPRPIALVSTVSPEGLTNLAPFSFFTAIGSHPMGLLFCPANKPDGSEKDTLRNCKPVAEGGVGEFVVNVATEDYSREVSAAAEALAHGESEFDLTGLERAASRVVRPPRLAISPIAFECCTLQVLRYRPGEPGGANVVFGQIVHLFVRDDLLDNRLRVDAERLAAIGRMGGLTYCTTRQRFDLPRGREALADAQTGPARRDGD